MPITEPITVAEGYVVLITQDCLTHSRPLMRSEDGVSPLELHGLITEEMWFSQGKIKVLLSEEGRTHMKQTGEHQGHGHAYYLLL